MFKNTVKTTFLKICLKIQWKQGFSKKFTPSSVGQRLIARRHDCFYYDPQYLFEQLNDGVHSVFSMKETFCSFVSTGKWQQVGL